MKFEFSAGGVVYKKEENSVQILLCQHSMSHAWGFPKGIIGDTKERESKEDTAIREVLEETGANARIVQELSSAKYWYVWEGERRKKTVYYFVMEYIDGDITKHDFEMENVEWLKPEDVEERLTYKGDKKIWNEAREYLKSRV